MSSILFWGFLSISAVVMVGVLLFGFDDKGEKW